MEPSPPTTAAAGKYQPTSRTTKYPPIPASEIYHLEMRAVKLRKIVWSTNRWRRKKQFYIKQLLFPVVDKKCQISFSRACLPSSHPLQKLEIVLIWSFYWASWAVSKLKRFKDHKKNTNFWNQINTAGAFQVLKFEVLLIYILIF